MSLFDGLTDLSAVESLIAAGERESESLEYKTASAALRPSERLEAAKDISAFANSLGGVIVYGVRTAADDPTLPVAIEDIASENVDYLMHSVLTAIKHPISGVRWRALPSFGTPRVLLVDVPQSADAPHQVTEHYRYYRRVGATSVPMSHDLVELYFGRRMQPRLEPLTDHATQQTWSSPEHVGQWSTAIALVNRGGQVARDVYTRFEAPVRCGRFYAQGWRSGSGGATDRAFAASHVHTYRHDGQLYYPGVPENFGRFALSVRTGCIGREHILLYLDIYAQDATPRRFGAYLTVQNPRMTWDFAWVDLGLPPVHDYPV